MQLIIGRDKGTSKLAVTIDSKTYTLGTAGTVPSSVSRQHCMLATTESDVMKITNLKHENITWVNGMTIDSCSIRNGQDRVELGVDRFLLDWNEINALIAKIESSKPKEIDITPLKGVWENYHRSINKIQKHQAFINACRGGIPLLTMGGVIAAFFIGDKESSIMPVIYVVAAIVVGLFFIIGIIDSVRNPKQKEKLTNSFTKSYCCPNCHYFFGYQAFDILKNNMDACPKCHAKVKK